MAVQPYRLLHLDDDDDQRVKVARSLHETLPSAQVELVSIADPQSLELALDGEPADCIITDSRLGWTDAAEVLRLVRDRWPLAGVVLYSGDAGPEAVASWIKNGADDFLLKSPDSIDRLGPIVREVVQQRRQEREEEDQRVQFQRLAQESQGTRHGSESTFAALPIGLWRSDPEGNLIDINPALQTLLGIENHQPLSDLNLFDCLSHFDDRAELLLSVREQPRVENFQTLLSRMDGSVVPVRLDATIHRDEDGKPTLIEGSAADFTETHDVLSRLSTSERQLRVLFERSNIGKIVTELPSNRVVKVNGRFCQMFGYSQDELLGQCVEMLWHPTERAGFLQKIVEDSQASVEEFDHEQCCLRKDGSTLWVQATGTILRDEQGRATYVIAAIYDATARRAEDDRLREMTRDTKLASEAKDRFLAQLSHELRTPLTPALTAAAVLSMDDRLPEDVRGDLETIRRNIELEARLIDDLLDLNRAVSGKLKLRRETFRVANLLHEAVAICSEDAAAKRLRLRLDVADDAGTIHADRTRLEQVAWNLLKNAVKFTPAGGHIDVTCRRVGERLVLSVEDTGIGLEAELIERIFGNFEQGNHANALNPGLGLGLAVARAIVELHGGVISARSDGPGKGSTFTVDLPAAAVSENAARDNRGTEQVLHGRLLLIEDHADTAAVLGKFLRRSGFSVRLAHSLADARSALAEMAAAGEHADVLLSDLDLPDGTAHDFIRETVNDVARPRPLAVAFSGHGTEAAIRESHDAGFDEHLTKPIPPDELLATLRRLLDERHALATSGSV